MDKISALFYKTVEETTKKRSMDLDLSGDRLKRRHDAFKRYYTDYIQKKYRNDEYIDTIVATHLMHYMYNVMFSRRTPCFTMGFMNR